MYFAEIAFSVLKKNEKQLSISKQAFSCPDTLPSITCTNYYVFIRQNNSILILWYYSQTVAGTSGAKNSGR